MRWIGLSEQDNAGCTLEERLWNAAADQAKARFDSLFNRRANLNIHVRFKSSMRLRLALLFLISAVLPASAALGLNIDKRGELILREVPFRGIGVNYYDAFT